MSTFSNENHVTRGFTSDAINESAFRLYGQVQYRFHLPEDAFHLPRATVNVEPCILIYIHVHVYVDLFGKVLFIVVSSTEY